MTDIKDLGKIVLEKGKDEAKKRTGGFDDILGGIFPKKPKFTENEDGTITREVKVGKQKLGITTVKLGDDKFVVNTIDTLDEKNTKKLTEKVSKGKKLSDDEKFWLNFKDRTAAGLAMIDGGVPAEQAAMVTAYSKNEMTGKEPVGDFCLNLDGYTGDKTALLDNLKKRMIEAYGADIGAKRFDELVSRSNLAEVVTKLDDKENVTETPETPKGEEKKEEKKVEESRAEEETTVTPKVEEPAQKKEAVKTNDEVRADVKASLQGAAVNSNSQPVIAAPVSESVKADMQADAKIAKIRDLMGRAGVKLQDKEATLAKLVENFGAEAAYQLALKSVVEPLHAMKAMDEGFRRSGASMEYFAAIDPNDAEKMAKVAALTGVSVEDMAAATHKKLKIEKIQPELPNALKLDINTTIDINSKDIKIVSPAEMQYNKMLGDKDKLTLGELLDYGVAKRFAAGRQRFDES